MELRTLPQMGQSPDPFTAVDVELLDENATLECDLYRRIPGSDHVLFLSRQCPFAADLWVTVREAHIRHLYVMRQETIAFVPYVLSRLEHALADAHTPIEHRATVALQSASFLLEGMIDGTHPDTISGLRDVVAATLDLAAEHYSALRAMMALTRQDRYARNHSLNVGVWGMSLAVMWGKTCEPPRAQQAAGWLASLVHGLFLHDIGKLRIPEEVLNYPGRYQPHHWAAMKQHPELGVKILEEAGFSDPVVLAVVLQHHERNDGSGYPQGLRSDRIAFEAKICTIADVFDALTNKRAYRDQSNTFGALGIMIDEMRQEFDPVLFEAFIRLFDDLTWARSTGRAPADDTDGQA